MITDTWACHISMYLRNIDPSPSRLLRRIRKIKESMDGVDGH
jgi:hypothetical protein